MLPMFNKLALTQIFMRRWRISPPRHRTQCNQMGIFPNVTSIESPGGAAQALEFHLRTTDAPAEESADHERSVLRRRKRIG
jgi:hypothetical protein